MTSPIPHGYTLASVDRLARVAITRNSWYRAADADERYAVAWHAIVEQLYTADEPPTAPDLIRAACYAADAHTVRAAEHRGHGRARGEHYAGRTDMPRWWAYWETVTRHTASPEDAVVERVALAQIWPRLAPAHQEALSALAAHGDYQAAADAVGVTRATFYARVRRARAAALALWWEGETPRRGWRDRRAITPPTQLHSISAHIRKRRRAGVAS